MRSKWSPANQNNKPIHMAVCSNQWRKNNGRVKMEWPTHSPDLNLVGNISKSMKSQISKLYQPQILNELKHTISASWNDIHYGVLNEELQSMPRRMQMVIVRFVYETLDNSSNIKSTMTVLSRKI
ncbi:hypothetical protein O181_091484 [Austropuccinia psidii MF-1]|uniref:Tc1-like transposase DDE domain-containing protein n=1 Tax=Austropuccinia psidii MF-1 TaxID=1389203 RepID=A0A9Q3IXN8_9BASI|nr:hypothetical protein [Austropuccinia psidii MF-1]